MDAAGRLGDGIGEVDEDAIAVFARRIEVAHGVHARAERLDQQVRAWRAETRDVRERHLPGRDRYAGLERSRRGRDRQRHDRRADGKGQPQQHQASWLENARGVQLITNHATVQFCVALAVRKMVTVSVLGFG